MANTGTVYLVQVGAFQANGFGTGTLTITELSGGGLPNDECAGATDVFSGVIETYDSSTATDSVGAWGCVDGGSDIWFRYFSATDSDITVSLCSGTSYDSAFEVYLADCSNLMSVLCNDDLCSLQSQGTFTPTASTDYLIRVGGYEGASGIGELLVTQAGPLGTNDCAANLNSTGQIGVMSAAGSAVAANNDVTLTASQLPPNTFGFFLTSPDQGFVPNPGGSAGNLCLGASVGRYIGPGQVQASNSSGDLSLLLDLTQTPQGNGTVSIQGGET